MNLFIDVGNTLTKVALDSGKDIKFLFAVASSLVVEDGVNALMKYIDYFPKDINNIYLSSVVPNAYNEIFDFAKFALKYQKVIRIDHTSSDLVKINIDNPKELGNDLLCDLVGAEALFGHPCLIVDMGTATKFLLIDDKGVFSTCSFVPGLEMSLNTLASNTALLPKLRLEKAKPLLDNHNTKDVMISSAYYSQIDMINGMVKRYKDEVDYPLLVILTGGNVKLIKDNFDFEYKLVDNLCLRGLKVIADSKK